MNTAKHYLRTLAIIILTLLLIPSILRFFVHKNDGGISLGMSESTREMKSVLKEAEKELSSGGDMITFDGITYERAKFKQELKRAKNELNRRIFADIFGPIIWVIILAGCLFLLLVWPSRCKTCKKWFSLEKISTELTKIENIFVIVENKTRSAYSNKVTEISEQHIPGKRETYQTTYACKHCGAKIYKHKTYDTPNT